MKTKELEKYPLQILMMTLTSFLTLLIPKLLSYLIDDILMANNKEKILPWFMITFGVTSLLMIMKFYFITYNPIKIGIKNTFRLQIHKKDGKSQWHWHCDGKMSWFCNKKILIAEDLRDYKIFIRK